MQETNAPDAGPRRTERRRAEILRTQRRHVQRPRRRRWLVALAAGGTVLVAAVAAATATAWGVGATAAPGCAAGATTTLRVAAAPDIAPVVRAIAGSAPTPAQGCVTADVSAAEPVDVVAGLTSGSIEPPDVWIPDSSLWLQRASTDHLASVPSAGTFATSPLVLAVPRGALVRPTLAALTEAAISGAATVRLHLSPQRQSPGRVGAVLALEAALSGRADARAALAGLLQHAVTSPDADRTGRGLAAAAAVGPAAGATSTVIDVVPLPEQDYLTASADRRPLTVVYPGASGGAVFDYPFAVLTRDGAHRAAAARLLARLRSSAAQGRITDAGFRDARGAADPLVARRGLDPAYRASTTALGEADAAQAEKLIGAVGQDARLLAVLDVSGSMGAHPTGTPNGATRISLAVGAAALGMAQYPDSTQVGLWVFADNRLGPRGHAEVAPFTPLGTGSGGRAALASALTKVHAVPGANTALYDAVLDATRTVRAGWVPGRVNAVVVLTDGQDTSSRATLTGLLEQLAANTAERPVPVISIAYGPDADVAVLRKIAAASGGAFYSVTDPRQIRAVFLDALAQRACRPDCPAGPAGR